VHDALEPLARRLLNRAYTRDQAHHYRDTALAELDAAGTIEQSARERLEGIMHSVISA